MIDRQKGQVAAKGNAGDRMTENANEQQRRARRRLQHEMKNVAVE